MRQSILAACVLTVVLAFAGCSGTGPVGDATDAPSPSENESYAVVVFDSGPTEYPVLEGGVQPDITPPPVGRHYATLLTTSEAADRFNHSVIPDNASTFIKATDFETASLLVVQAYPKSSVPDYRVESVTRDGDRLHVRINDSSNIGTDDITLETVIVRVDHDGNAPQSATIETQGNDTFDTDDEGTTVTGTTTRLSATTR